MNTIQKENKYIPEGAKCKSHTGLNGLHYPLTGFHISHCKTIHDSVQLIGPPHI